MESMQQSQCLTIVLIKYTISQWHTQTM